MTSQPDKLFRDKLENFQRPAPAGAWDKLEKNLSRPSKKIVWMRVAAGIALITAAAIILWPEEKEKHHIAVKQDEVTVPEKDSAQQKEVFNQPKQQFVDQLPVAKAEQPKSKKQNVTPSVPEQTIVPQEPVIISTSDQHELVAEVEVLKETESVSTTLVYTAAEVNSKFLKKKLPPEATPPTEDASHIQKLIGLAYAAKNSETGLGELRQKKDDLLALSFGKKKGEN